MQQNTLLLLIPMDPLNNVHVHLIDNDTNHLFLGQVVGLDSRLTGTEGKSTSLLQKFSQYFCNILKVLHYKMVKYYRLISCSIKLLQLMYV